MACQRPGPGTIPVHRSLVAAFVGLGIQLLCCLSLQHRVEYLFQHFRHGFLALAKHQLFQNIIFQCRMYLSYWFIPFSCWFAQTHYTESEPLALLLS